MRQSPATPISDGDMNPEDLRAAGECLYGSWGWQTRLAEALKVDGSTVRRWVSGKVAIPGMAAVAIRLLIKVQQLEAEKAARQA